jgi:DNA mismatch repair ATPase MutS
MRKEDWEYIKKCVYQNIAVAYCGRVTLSQVYRLFSDYGSLEDLEKCLDSFVKEGIAEKLDEGKIYVFKDIATKFEKKWKDQLEELVKQKDMILSETSKKKDELKVLNELYNLWYEGWEKVENQSLKSGIKNYISMFWQSTIKEYVKTLQELENKLSSVESGITKLRNRLEIGG